MIPDIHIEQITPELTWRLRHQVLYPEGTINDMAMPQDEQGTHFGAFFENKLAGIVSLFHQGNNFQFRKLAVDPAMQHKNIGTQLLQYITRHAAEHGGTRLWCNARLTAAGFYEKAGFTPTGGPFRKNGFDYVIIEKTIS